MWRLTVTRREAFRPNRTQEVAGSSPASSIKKGPVNRGFSFLVSLANFTGARLDDTVNAGSGDKTPPVAAGGIPMPAVQTCQEPAANQALFETRGGGLSGSSFRTRRNGRRQVREPERYPRDDSGEFYIRFKDVNYSN
jgi:hypothetical protein